MSDHFHPQKDQRSFFKSPEGSDYSTNPVQEGLSTPETKRIAQLQAAANSSPQVAAFQSLQETANHSEQVKQTGDLQDLANGRAGVLPPPNPGSGGNSGGNPQKNQTGLPDKLKQGIEAMSGFSLDQVKVHYNSPRPFQIGAHAFAQGTNIFLGPGQEKHLPHETWHIVQQMQGKVSPEGKTPENETFNDQPVLEQEADQKGLEALHQGHNGEKDSPAEPKALTRPVNPVIQAVWIKKDGKKIWKDDPNYELEEGEEYYFPDYWQSRPSVIFNSGKSTKEVDEKGKLKTSRLKRKPPTHKELQKERAKQGKLMLEKVRKREAKKLKTDVRSLNALAEKLEKQAGDAVPKNHRTKLRKFEKTHKLKGGNFRDIYKNQDELTQTQASTHFLNGFRPEKEKDKEKRKLLEEYWMAMLRVMSSLRAPTQSIVAPFKDGKKILGQQHPTSKDQPKVEGGGSSHSYSDRSRVYAQNKAFSNLHSEASVSPNDLFLGTLLSAGTSTLSSMSWPTTAKNVGKFNSKRARKQVRERERIKKQMGTIMKTIGYNEEEEEQDLNSPIRRRKRPLSPRRTRKKKEDKMDTSSNDTDSSSESESREERKKKKRRKKYRSSGESSERRGRRRRRKKKKSEYRKSSKENTSRKRKHDEVEQDKKNTAINSGFTEDHRYLGELIGKLEKALDVEKSGFSTFSKLHKIKECYQLIDPYDMDAYPDLFMIFESASQLYKKRADQFLTGEKNGQDSQHNDVDEDSGLRLPSFEQSFAECGQMAAHNALSFAEEDWEDDIYHLNSLGDFEDFIEEGQIRYMLGEAGHEEIPVIGNLAQFDQLVQLVQQGDQQGLNDLGTSLGETISLIEMDEFIQGNIDEITMVVNTESHQDETSTGYHWIAVNLVRDFFGGIEVKYKDSLSGDTDYSDLFDAIKAMVS